MGLLDHVKIENLDEDQRKMVELVGLDGFKSLVRAFGGTTIYIPKAESLERAARDQKIREEKELHVDAIAKNPFAWLTFSQGNTLIEVLKGYLKSLERKEAASDGIVRPCEDRKPG